MNHSVIALIKNAGIVEVKGQEVEMDLPDGCTGFCLVFESKTKARACWGNDVELVRVRGLKGEEEAK